jgi:hypothetical protein
MSQINENNITDGRALMEKTINKRWLNKYNGMMLSPLPPKKEILSNKPQVALMKVLPEYTTTTYSRVLSMRVCTACLILKNSESSQTSMFLTVLSK